MYCLLCLKNFVNDVEYIDAYSDEGLRLNVSSVINKHFWLQIGQSTKHICKVCWNAVHEFHSFYRRIVDVHQQLLVNYMNSDKTSPNELITSFKTDTILYTDLKDDTEYGKEQEIITQNQEKSSDRFNENNENPYNANGISGVFEPQIDIYEESLEDHVEENLLKQICDEQIDTVNDEYKTQVVIDSQAAASIYDIERRSLRSRTPNKLSYEKVKREPSININDNECSYETHETYETADMQQNINSNIIETNTSGQNIYRCDSCNHVSTTASGLKRHKYFIHVCLKKYKCSMCTKAFKRKQYLTEHISVHTGVFLYSCTICETKFKAKSNLFHHLKRKHNTVAKDGPSKLFYTEIND